MYALPPCRWFTALQLLRIEAPLQLTTAYEETCALLLSGTFDLVGGTTRWPSRGARSDPLAGRPVAVFLPPRTRFLVEDGHGEILLVAARQPADPASTGRAALSQSPLLPLAGSGKAFDPGTGEWRMAETFPAAAESLPPRRIEQVRLGEVSVERVFARDYKAATLTVDEAVVPAGACFTLADLSLPPAVECLLYVRTRGNLKVTAGASAHSVTGEQGLCFPGEPGALQCTAAGAPAYVVLAYAGK
jgi:hypothetical protein